MVSLTPFLIVSAFLLLLGATSLAVAVKATAEERSRRAAFALWLGTLSTPVGSVLLALALAS